MVRKIKSAHGLQHMFILDTNVLIHDPRAMFAFEGSAVGIPAVVLEELDALKKEGTDRGRNSREAIRLLDGLRSHGSLGAGVPLENGGTVTVLFLPRVLPEFPFHGSIEDNEILLTALTVKLSGMHVTFISKDINARVKADALGLETQDYKKETVSQEEFYHGWIRLPVPAVQLKAPMPSALEDLVATGNLTINQYIIVESQHNEHNYVLFQYMGGKDCRLVHHPKFQWPLQARNVQQLMALDLLMNDKIQLVALLGPAGTGKTFLALLAGLHKVLVEEHYKKMLISRPIMPLGRDLGYLPGEVQDKLRQWMLPIYDNMEFMVHSVASSAHLSSLRDNRSGHGDEERHRKPYKHEHHKNYRDGEHRGKGGYKGGHGEKIPHGALLPLDELIKRGKIALEAVTYMRGRSIPYQFILIDEAQNLTPHEIKTLVTRVGEGSKIVLCGDPFQIDSPYLDFASNGLVATSERFKGHRLFGSVFLETSERSELSQLAGELL